MVWGALGVDASVNILKLSLVSWIRSSSSDNCGSLAGTSAFVTTITFGQPSCVGLHAWETYSALFLEGCIWTTISRTSRTCSRCVLVLAQTCIYLKYNLSAFVRAIVDIAFTVLHLVLRTCSRTMFLVFWCQERLREPRTASPKYTRKVWGSILLLWQRIQSGA